MLVGHSLVYALARGVPGIVNFLAIAVYTRLLVPDEYGAYSLALASVALADSFLFHWLRLGLLRFLPADGPSRSGFLASVRTVFLLASAGLLVLVLLLSPLLGRWLPPGLLLASVFLLVTQGFFELNLEVVRSGLTPARYGLLATVRSVLSLGFGALLAWLGYGAAGLVGGIALGMLLSLLLLAQWRNWPRAADWRPDAAVTRRLFHYGLPLAVTFALGFIVSTSDRFLLGWFLGTDATGLYAVGYDLSQFTVMMVLSIVNLASYPLIVRAMEETGAAAARQHMSLTLLLLLGVGLPVTLVLVLLPGPIAGIVAGPDFRATAAAVIPWIAVSVLLSGIKAFYVDVGFQLGERTAMQAWVMLLAAVLNVGLNVWLIPVHGLYGAIWSTLVVYVVALLSSLWLVRSTFPLPRLHPDVWRVLAANAVLALVVILLPDPASLTRFLLTLLATGAAYGLSLLLLVPRLRSWRTGL